MNNSSENPEYQNKIKKPLTKHLPTGQAGGYIPMLIICHGSLMKWLRSIKENYSNRQMLTPEESINKVLADSGNEMNPNPKSDPRN
ncbi:hypothetical protein SAMN00777080_0025 [Aquiflexum balticum DSM 16537]|uniref:Uncharacterized protein n=1 Tax=Aquiflexum balticum DSM 16537 TaxID=758820 RepID=A0A1W2GY17_9BACT|nr:hypothetical protein SAMN00777080_0025 [Aquiflexum balticum DSM 16537]